MGKQTVHNKTLVHPVEKNLFHRIIDSFQEATKLRVRSSPIKKKKPIRSMDGEGPTFCKIVQSCSVGKKRCLREIRRATKMAIKTGEPYIFQCHADLIECAATILNGGNDNYALVCGPVLLRHSDLPLERDILKKVQDLSLNKSLLLRSLSEVPVFSERRVQAASDLLFTMANYFAKIDWIFHREQREVSLDSVIDAVGMEAHGEGVYDRVKHALRMESDRPNALREAIQACRPGGTVSIPGVYGGVIDQMPMGAAFGKGLTFRMGQTHVHRYMRSLLRRVEDGEIDPRFIITHRLTLDDAPAAYRAFRDKEDGCVKVVMKPGAGNGRPNGRERSPVIG